jgi:hypothetical protein
VTELAPPLPAKLGPSPKRTNISPRAPGGEAPPSSSNSPRLTPSPWFSSASVLRIQAGTFSVSSSNKLGAR